MTELDIVGLGAWGEDFSNWQELRTGIRTGQWQSDATLQPKLMSARERRRAPQSVKTAVEVMSQACEMAELSPLGIASVFSSAMGDMQITDYMCKLLATSPEALSPTQFHNSVHNAPTGYWSIATKSLAPASAVSAYSYSAPMAFLEAAVQASEEEIPVLVVTQEMDAPDPLKIVCPSEFPFSAAFLLAPKGYNPPALVSVGMTVSSEPVEWPELPDDLRNSLSKNFGARLLPLFAAIAAFDAGSDAAPRDVKFPLTQDLCLTLSVHPPTEHESFDA